MSFGSVFTHSYGPLPLHHILAVTRVFDTACKWWDFKDDILYFMLCISPRSRALEIMCVWGGQGMLNPCESNVVIKGSTPSGIDSVLGRQYLSRKRCCCRRIDVAELPVVYGVVVHT